MSPITIQIRTVSAPNRREHWAKKARRVKSERLAAYLAIPSLGAGLPSSVKLTRIAPRSLDDDNLRGCLKAVRDGIADRLGIDDRDPRVEWCYGQEKGAPKEYAVRVGFEFSGAA